MHPITQHAPLHGARLKKCAACGQVKPLTAYTARGHKRCSDCIGYTHGRAGANGRLRRPANAPITNATTTELYDGAELCARPCGLWRWMPLRGPAGMGAGWFIGTGGWWSWASHADA